MLPLASKLKPPVTEKQSKEESTKYETRILGPIYGPVHTGSGNIEVAKLDHKSEL
jgi:hypothetical protein